MSAIKAGKLETKHTKTKARTQKQDIENGRNSKNANSAIEIHWILIKSNGRVVEGEKESHVLYV